MKPTIMNQDKISQHFSEHIAVIEQTRLEFSSTIVQIGEIVARALANSGTLFWCGNGGSAADSQHIAAELVGRFKKNRRPLRSIALTTDTSVLTCIANDFGYDDIFARQIEALGRPSDVLIAITTSGNSENIRCALLKANELGLTTIALLGKGGGICKDLADIALVIPSDTTARIQETHILIGHLLCEMIEQELDLA